MGGEGHRNLTLMDAFPGRNGRRLFHAVEQQLLSLAAPTLQFSHFSLTLCLPPLSLSSFLSVFFISHALYESHFMHAKLVYVRNFKRSVKSYVGGAGSR